VNECSAFSPNLEDFEAFRTAACACPAESLGLNIICNQLISRTRVDCRPGYSYSHCDFVVTDVAGIGRIAQDISASQRVTHRDNGVF
jgi:hypothetical protein